MKKIFLLFIAISTTLVIFAQNDDVYPTAQTNAVEDTDIFVDIAGPAFPGGTIALLQYINENVQYPTHALKKQIQGRSICKFYVEEDGSISHVRVVRSSGCKALDRAAVRMIKSMPKWTPGRNWQGEFVRTGYYLPVNFRIPYNEK